MLTYRGPGAWGSGTGLPLTQPQFDGNTYYFDTRLTALETNPPTPNEIASIEVAGTAMTITLEGGQEFGPYPLPVLMFRWRGEWAPLTLHAVLDSFSVENSGLYVSLRAHTTAATFDPDAVGAAVTAGAFAVGTLYRIATVGTTDFTAIGAASNTVGVDFTATGAGNGTGTATPKTYYQLIGAGSNTALGDLLDVDVTGAAANAMLVAVSVGSPATIEWQDRTPTQVTALLDDFVGDTGSPGGGIKGLVPAPADGDAAANKVLRADGTWGVGSTVAALDDLTDVSTAGVAVGDLLVAGGSPISWSPSSPGDIGSAISDLPLATLPVAALSLLEIAETDGGSPASYVSKHIRISDLVHTLGSTAIAMGATITTIAGLTLSGASLTGATTLTGSGQITSAGELGLGGSPSARLDILGTYTSANSALMRAAATHASSVTTAQRVLNFAPTLAPSGASLSAVDSVFVSPTLNSTAFTIGTWNGVIAGLTLGASFSGVVSTFNIFHAANPTVSGGSITNLNSYFVAAITNGDGLAAGSVTNHGVRIQSISAGAAGGTVNNRGIFVSVPTGGASSGTTNNRGIYISGNGGTATGSPPGTVNNFALFSDSTAPMQIGGTFQFLGSTSSFPMFKRNGTSIEVRLADDSALAPIASSKITTSDTAFMHNTSAALANGAAAGAGTITNAPAAGNPTKWIPINDNGTTRYIPAW